MKGIWGLLIEKIIERQYSAVVKTKFKKQLFNVKLKGSFKIHLWCDLKKQFCRFFEVGMFLLTIKAFFLLSRTLFFIWNRTLLLVSINHFKTFHSQFFSISSWHHWDWSSQNIERCFKITKYKAFCRLNVYWKLPNFLTIVSRALNKSTKIQSDFTSLKVFKFCMFGLSYLIFWKHWNI